MVDKYVRLIENGVINPRTDKAWCVEDVPALWQKQVKEILRANGKLITN